MRALRGLRLEARDVEHLGAAAEGLPEVLEQERLVLARDRAVALVRERREAVVAAEQHRERGLDRARLASGMPWMPGREPKTARQEKCSTSRSRSIAGLVTTATDSLK